MKKSFIFLPLAFALGACAFAAENAERVQSLPSGVVVRHLVEGSGAKPTPRDVVQVHYKGTLESGAEFDSSYRRNAPATFPLGRVVPCWTQGVQELRVGGKAVLTCPAATAYGERGIPGVIPPNSVLTFEVELLSIVGP